MNKSGNSPLLEIQGLSAWYTKNKPVLENLNLTISQGEVVGLIGLNGAGKTTLIRILTGILKGYNVGEATWRQKPVSLRSEDFKRQRYTVFAEDASFEYFTFDEYLDYVMKAYGKKAENISGLVNGFHFEGFRGKLLRDLSTGNRKKAFLITAFALRTELLLMDEPVNGLDFQSTEYLYEQIRLYRQHGTILFSSHVLESLCLTADNIWVLENGTTSRTFTGDEITADTIRGVLHDDGNL